MSYLNYGSGFGLQRLNHQNFLNPYQLTGDPIDDEFADDPGFDLSDDDELTDGDFGIESDDDEDGDILGDEDEEDDILGEGDDDILGDEYDQGEGSDFNLSGDFFLGGDDLMFPY